MFTNELKAFNLDLTPADWFLAERLAFPDYYEEYLKSNMASGVMPSADPLACVGPVRYVGQALLEKDLDNLRTAVEKVPHVDVFVPATAPTGVGLNDYYSTEEEYLVAVSDALRVEYPSDRHRSNWKRW